MSLRDYELMEQVEKFCKKLPERELEAACEVMDIISRHLTYRHFEKQEEIDVKALVKTFEELFEIAFVYLEDIKSKNK